MDSEEFRDILMKKSWKELYQLRCDQYATKGELVDDIIAHDDGSVHELIETEGSFLWLMAGRALKRRLEEQMETGKEKAPSAPHFHEDSGQGMPRT